LDLVRLAAVGHSPGAQHAAFLPRFAMIGNGDEAIGILGSGNEGTRQRSGATGQSGKGQPRDEPLFPS
jgi:hypothetical protein